MMSINSISSYEFNRISEIVNLKGKFTAEEIQEALVQARNRFGEMSERANTREALVINHSKKVVVQRLVEHGFPERVVTEARLNPQGRIALTLKYGREEAKRRLAKARANQKKPTVRS